MIQTASGNSYDVMVDQLLKSRQHTATQEEKEAVLFPLLRELTMQAARSCKPYGSFIADLYPDIESGNKISDIPYLPVTMFKKFELSNVPTEKIVRILRSSSTTGQTPSSIYVDKMTAFRQARALISILKEYIGASRRPFLILDVKESVGEGDSLTARGAALRGIGNFATESVFALQQTADGDMTLDFDRVSDFMSKYQSQPILLFGFTFIVWSKFLLELEKRNITFNASEAILLHSGGWKKLISQAVSKDVFSNRVSKVLGCTPTHILDFYGMVEQVGTVFVDCEAGHKHAPSFADVILRRPHTLEPVRIGETGIIEVVSILPTSYPGHALITEDQGRLIGIDDCPCGRLGTYFDFTSRIERTEVRGCGDTFAQSRELK